MLYSVSIYPKGNPVSIMDGTCQFGEFDKWIQRGKELSAKHGGKRMIVQFRPREHSFEVGPEGAINSSEIEHNSIPSDVMVSDEVYPKQGTSPSVCELLNRGD